VVNNDVIICERQFFTTSFFGNKPQPPNTPIRSPDSSPIFRQGHYATNLVAAGRLQHTVAPVGRFPLLTSEQLRWLSGRSRNVPSTQPESRGRSDHGHEPGIVDMREGFGTTAGIRHFSSTAATISLGVPHR